MTKQPRRETTRVGRRGTIVLPARLRRQTGIEEGSIVIAEQRDGGILIRPAVVIPIELYSPERIAQFLLTNAVDAAEYEEAREEVRRMNLDPDAVPHIPPGRA